MRHQITITGELDTWADETTVERDAPDFLRAVERVHSGIVPGSVSLVSVERLPDREPSFTVAGETDGIQEQLDAIQSMLDALRQASRSA